MDLPESGGVQDQIVDSGAEVYARDAAHSHVGGRAGSVEDERGEVAQGEERDEGGFREVGLRPGAGGEC